MVGNIKFQDSGRQVLYSREDMGALWLLPWARKELKPPNISKSDGIWYPW